jgi:hypothetical protein
MEWVLLANPKHDAKVAGAICSALDRMRLTTGHLLAVGLRLKQSLGSPVLDGLQILR